MLLLPENAPKLLPWTLLWHLHTLHSPYRPVDISTAYNPKARCNVPYQLPSTFPTPFAPPCPRTTYPWQAALPLLVGRFAFIAGRLDIFAAYAHTATIIFLYWPCVASPVFIAYLRRLEGVPVENADAGCCGISDSYGFKKEKYDITQTVGSELFDKVRESGAQAAVSECGTCRVQITHGSGKFSLHPVSILRQRLEAR